MTNPTNWPNPERPGFPMFHERGGWHLLQIGGTITALRWRPLRTSRKWTSPLGVTYSFAELTQSGVTTYIGPCLTLVQISELLAGERERCAEICESLAPRQGYSILGNVGDSLEYAAKAIRNLGAAP